MHSLRAMPGLHLHLGTTKMSRTHSMCNAICIIHSQVLLQIGNNGHVHDIEMLSIKYVERHAAILTARDMQ